MSEQVERYRIYSHVTRSKWLHLEDSLNIGKVRLFAGDYQKGKGAKATAIHYLDVADGRVLFNDLAWGKPVDYCEFKGNGNSGQPISRVLKVKTNGDKVWFGLENGPGQVIGQGAVKPAGKPDAVVNVPLTTWEARRLAFAVLAHLDAWEVITFKKRTQGEGR
jgi:hypothetical protein